MQIRKKYSHAPVLNHLTNGSMICWYYNLPGEPIAETKIRGTVLTDTTMFSFESLKQRSQNLKCEVYALYLARSEPRIPWHAKAVIVLTVAYALKPD